MRSEQEIREDSRSKPVYPDPHTAGADSGISGISETVQATARLAAVPPAPANKYRKLIRSIDGKETAEIDVYSVLEAFGVESHGVAQAIKKLLMAGTRGAKDFDTDLIEAIQAIQRALSH
jgi:hypothetical protein